MLRIDRVVADAVSCLEQHDPDLLTWDELDPTCKKQLRGALQALQADRCAYCEGPLHGSGHIEHLFRKRLYRHLTFRWDNLFLSCDDSEHCGHFKDRRGAPPYDPRDLLKPDVDDSRRYFYFHSNGVLRIRSGTSAGEAARAVETIRVFSLDHDGLVAERRTAARRYTTVLKRNLGIEGDLKSALESWYEELGDELFAEWVGEELVKTEREPFASTLRDLLG